MQVVQGLLAMIGGFLVLVFRARIKDFTGDIGFAERYLGPGGTWTFLLILGVLLFIIGLMWATGSFQILFWDSLGGFF